MPLAGAASNGQIKVAPSTDRNITLASCLAQEVSLEWDKVGHGLLSHFFARALAGEADVNRDGIVDSDEVYTYVFERVVATSRRELNRSQRPVRFIPPTTIGKFPLTRIDDAWPRADADTAVGQPDSSPEVEPAQAGAKLQIFCLDAKTARSQYEHAGVGTPLDSVADRDARWSPKQALSTAKQAVAQVYEEAIVAGLWTGYWQVPTDGSYTSWWALTRHIPFRL